MKRWSRVSFLAMLLAVWGCGEGAILVKEFDNGGVVVYPYRAEQGNLLSSFRTGSDAPHGTEMPGGLHDRPRR